MIPLGAIAALALDSKGSRLEPKSSKQIRLEKCSVAGQSELLLSLMWLTEIPWVKRVWALPCLTVLVPSERYYADSSRRPKKLLDWARQMICQLRRWLPTRPLLVVGDKTYAALDLLHEPAPVYTGVGRPRKKGTRLPSLQAVLTNPKTCWRRVNVKWYDGQQRQMELTSQTTVWYHPGKPVVPIRWVLIRDPKGKYDPLALL